MTLDNSVTVVHLDSGNEHNVVGVGMTLDSFLRSGMPSPFTAESLAAFQDKWESKDFQTVGSFSMQSDVVTSMDEKIEMLDMGGSLSVSYLMFSVCAQVHCPSCCMGIYSECIWCGQGDAHMNFLSENVQSDTDVSVLVRASSAGKKKQMTLADTNLLKLKETTLTTVEEFEEMYGMYVVVGYLYAGEILFESTYSASNSEDKTAIEGGLSYV